ncbi:hypothetical protein IMZ48_42310, partial [Candidatus Bathyarchaeota archaeon]|nr:hypothetical protein [Candidatus Bathyarchaeota archaeon]
IWAYLLGKIGELKFGRFLAQALDDPGSGALRETVNTNVSTLIQKCGEIDQTQPEARYTGTVNVIHVLYSLSKWPGAEVWMQKVDVLAWLKQSGRDLDRDLRNFSLPAQLRLPADQAGAQVVSILVKALEQSPKDIEPLFSLVDSVTSGDLRATRPLYSHIYKHIICNDSVEFWRATFLKCLDIYASKTASQKTKWFLLHNIVNPIVAMDVKRNWGQAEAAKGPRLMDRAVLDAVTNRMWKVHSETNHEDSVQPGIDHTRFEALQLSAMIVKYCHSSLQDSRKDIIRFGWTYIRLDDVIIKHAAYVVLGYFIAMFDTPAKITTQIYVSLLRINQSEGKALVGQALELVAPVLPKRCNTLPNDRAAPWAIAPRRVLADEGQPTHQMSSIFTFLAKHPDLFYCARDKYIPLIISTLRKVATPPNPSNENRKLALNMMWLIWVWEQRRVEGKEESVSQSPSVSPSAKRQRLDSRASSSPSAARQGPPSAVAFSESPSSKKRKLEGDPVAETSSQSAVRSAPPVDKTEYVIPPAARLRMIKFLVEFIARLNDRYPLPSAKPKEAQPLNGPAQPSNPGEMCRKSIRLLYSLLQPQYWGDLDLDLFSDVTTPILASDKTQAVLAADPSDKEKYDEKSVTSIINTLQVVRVILNFKSDEWINKNITSLLKVLEKSLRSENPEIQDCLHVADKEYDGGLDITPIMKRIIDAV